MIIGRREVAFLDVALEIETNLFFHHAVIGLLFCRRRFQCPIDDLLRLLAESDFTGDEATSHYFGRPLHLAGALVDGDDRQHDAIFAQVPAVADHQVFDHVRGGTGIDANPAGGHFARLDRGVGVHFKHVAVFEQQSLIHHAGVLGQLHVLLQVTVIPMNRK